jgi:hypothetical protein
MKKVSAYQCDFCPKASTKAGAMALHERKCKQNPNNHHKCFDFCRHLQKIYKGHNRSGFICLAQDIEMYSYKAEHSSIDIKGLTRMPLECKFYAYMTNEQENERFGGYQY